MAGPPSLYNPGRVRVFWGGIPLLGFAPGTFLSITRDEPTWKTVRGTNGEVKRIKQSGKSGLIELTLRQSTFANRLLGVMHKVDEEASGIILPLAVADQSGGALAYAPEAFIDKYAALSYGRDEPDIVWSFVCNDLDITYPGFTLEAALSRM